MQTVYGKSTKKLLEEIDPQVQVIVLEESFGGQDPGEAAEKLLAQLGSAPQ